LAKGQGKKLRAAAAALYKKVSAADAQMMSFFGLKPEDYPEDDVIVWPDVAPTINVFIAMGTQWRVSAGGAYGLDYGVLPDVLRMRGVPRSQWPELFDDLRICEDAALEQMRRDD
jgi:hypothetical protein